MRVSVATTVQAPSAKNPSASPTEANRLNVQRAPVSQPLNTDGGLDHEQVLETESSSRARFLAREPRCEKGDAVARQQRHDQGMTFGSV